VIIFYQRDNVGSFVGSTDSSVQHRVAEPDSDFALVHNFVDLGF